MDRQISSLVSYYKKENAFLVYTPGGGTPLQEPNGDVPLDGVTFSRLEWL